MLLKQNVILIVRTEKVIVRTEKVIVKPHKASCTNGLKGPVNINKH